MTLQARFAQVRRLFAAGVGLTAGSEAGIHPAKPRGVLPFAVEELALSGLPVPAAVRVATAASADACGLAAATGRLRAGLSADLLVVDGDLATDLHALTRVRDVVLRGLVVVTGAAPPGPS